MAGATVVIFEKRVGRGDDVQASKCIYRTNGLPEQNATAEAITRVESEFSHMTPVLHTDEYDIVIRSRTKPPDAFPHTDIDLDFSSRRRGYIDPGLVCQNIVKANDAGYVFIRTKEDGDSDVTFVFGKTRDSASWPISQPSPPVPRVTPKPQGADNFQPQSADTSGLKRINTALESIIAKLNKDKGTPPFLTQIPWYSHSSIEKRNETTIQLLRKIEAMITEQLGNPKL